MSVFDIVQMVITSPQWWICLVIALSLIQISPLKLDPWTWIGNAFNKDVFARMDELEKRIDEIETGVNLANYKCDRYEAQREEDKAVMACIRILRFNDELLHKKRHSKETFDQILKDVKFYEKYCDDNKDFENERAVRAIKNVRRCYDKCSEDCDFLDEDDPKYPNINNSKEGGNPDDITGIFTGIQYP